MTLKTLSLTITALALALGGCSTLSLDKDRATEARKQELCADISTRDLPQCVGTTNQDPGEILAARLAPDSLPEISGFEVGQYYEAGSGLMAGDFFDVYRVGHNRLAAVIGDVAGHGIESSITAFQAKYLLRVFLRQFRDPAQALEELNQQMAEMDRGEEFISMIVVVFDTEAGTIRYASAGHPAGWLWHGREVAPLRATGPLLMLDPGAPYHSRELVWDIDDVAVLYTDGLAEARNGTALFGEDGVASMIRRDPTASPDVLTKVLVEAARDFAGGPITDDLAVLVLRRTT